MGPRPEPVNHVRLFPLLPLRGMLVFPHMVVHLEVGREKSVAAVEEALANDRLIVLASQRETRQDRPDPSDIHEIGTIAEVKQLIKLPSGTIRVLVEGIARVRVHHYVAEEPCFRVRAEELSMPDEGSSQAGALMRTAVHQYEQYMKLSKRIPAETMASVTAEDRPGRLADIMAAHLHGVLKPEDRQDLLEALDPAARLELACQILGREIEILELERRISSRVRKQMEKTQKEYYLREQIKAIHKELGDKEDRTSEVDEYRQKIADAGLPPEVEERALRELDRLEKMPAMAAEAVVVRTYLDWIVGLPWSLQTEDRLDVTGARGILDEDHYGLEKPKERILEYLAIRQLAKELRGPILCFVGPPGTGKTSVARSVARALDRRFVRISLGGVRDEAEIRGHRRTYVGALPGRILQGMRRAGSRNPVFLMDEVDKLASDFRGDPAAALLEVLDPEQNHAFSDHYLELPFDLSKVLFITTANTSHTIPRPLLDRMEVINLPGYTEDEKVAIALHHLLPRVVPEHGLQQANLEISEGALRAIIREYTREAGVRNLERELATACRKTAKEIVEGRPGPARITTSNLHLFLGPPRFRLSLAEKSDEVGVATAVAVTESGGDIMPIEVTVMRGKGTLLLTGKLGEVMRESAQAAFSYIRSRARELGIEENFHERYDLHVHIPEGAMPKEGPSAGIAMAVAVTSALSNRPVRRDVAMTGEITLRGRVLPVGGVKEKALGAHRAGMKTMLLPRENEKDLEEVPLPIRQKLEFVLVDHMDQVLELALAGSQPVAFPEEALPPVRPELTQGHPG
ncbi:MAG: endopeptidase La [bacterium]|nr:endopeptidase La [bacterium]